MGRGANPATAGCLAIRVYDERIQTSVKRWWPDYPLWLDWRAQLCQESRLDPAALSPVGAAGLAQFMPGTWADVSRRLGYGDVSPHVARYAIEAGAYYMASLRRQWSSPRPDERPPGAGAGLLQYRHGQCAAGPEALPRRTELAGDLRLPVAGDRPGCAADDRLCPADRVAPALDGGLPCDDGLDSDCAGRAQTGLGLARMAHPRRADAGARRRGRLCPPSAARRERMPRPRPSSIARPRSRPRRRSTR